jgi:hypothetical protein
METVKSDFWNKQSNRTVVTDLRNLEKVLSFVFTVSPL